MKTFSQFLTERRDYPAVRAITRGLLECGVDPVRYVYLRLFEGQAPAPAAAGAPAAPPAPGAAPAPAAGAPPAAPAPAPAGGAPAPAAAGQQDPALQDVTAMEKQVNDMLNKYGKDHPEMGKVIAQLQKDIAGLKAAQQKDAQAKAGAPAAPGAPGAKPAPGAGAPPAPAGGAAPAPAAPAAPK